MASGNYSQKLDDEPDLTSDQTHPKTKYIKAKRCVWCCCATIWIFLAIQVTFLPHFIRHKVHDGLIDALVITSNTTSGFDSWKANTKSDSVVPWMECRFFNVTNVYDIIHNGALPKLKITPPMVYNEISVKYNVSWSEDKEWAMYNTWEYYTLNEKRSYLDPKAEITIISPLIGALYYGQQWSTDFWKHEEIRELAKMLKYINVTDLLLWKGTAKDLLFDIYHVNISNEYIQKYIEIPFGLLGNGSNWNSTNGGNETFRIINTGHKDHEKMGELKYLGKFGEYIECWNPAQSLLPGHDTYYGIGAVKKNKDILAFVSSLSLNVVIDYNYSHTWQGIELYRFTVQSSPQFDNITYYPPNAQFYQFTYNGIENMTRCSGGLPLFISFPNFLAGDERLIKNAKTMGLPTPSWKLNQPFIDVEPKTGAIFRANKSLQINTMIHSIDWIANDTKYSSGYYNIPDDIVVPVIELCECEQLTDSQAKDFRSLVVDSLKYADILEILGYIAVGLVLLFLLSSAFVYGKISAFKQQQKKDIQQKLFN